MAIDGLNNSIETFISALQNYQQAQKIELTKQSVPVGQQGKRPKSLHKVIDTKEPPMAVLFE